MAAPTVFASNRQFCGIANDVTPGTPVAMTATIPVDTLAVEDKPLMLGDEALRGSMGDETDVLVGPIYSEVSFAGPAFVDTLGYLLRNIMGDYTGTGSSAPFTHAFSLLNSGSGQPGTHTLTDYEGIAASHGARAYSGMVLTDLGINWNPETELLKYTAKAVAWPSAITAATPTPNPTTLRAQPSWQMAVGIGGPASGGTLVGNTGEGSVTIARAASVRWTNQGTVQAPFVIGRGKFGVTFGLRSIAQDESPLLALVAGTIQPYQFLISAGSVQALQIDINNGSYRSAATDLSKELIEWNSALKAEQNTTNAGASGGRSPAKFTLTNSVATSVY